MKKPFIKILTVLSIIFISFFVGKTSALAACRYYTNTSIVVGNDLISGHDIKNKWADNSISVFNAGKPFGVIYNKNIGRNFRAGTFNTYDNSFPTHSFTFSSSSFEKYVKNNGCPDFAKLYKPGGTKGLELVPASKNDFLNHSYYSGKVIKDKVYYYDPESDVKDNNYEIYLILVGAEKKYEEFKYPNKVLNKLIELNGNNKDELIKKIKSCGIDTGDYSIAGSYYNNTKSTISRLLEQGKFNEIVNKDSYYAANGLTFNYWFERVSRYILENDVKNFSKYYTQSKGEETVEDTSSNENFCLNIAKAYADTDDLYKKSDSLESDTPICNYYCYSENSNAQTACYSSDAYKKCVNCYTIGSASEQTKCLEAYNSKASENKKMLDSKIDEKEEVMKKYLSKISPSGLSNIEFDYKYQVNCDDFKTLHTIYVILEIAAPIAVILLGSLDYAKAVMASDIEKMEKSKKKFPKRLLLLLLFVFVPIIIQIIIKLFSQTNDSVDLDTSLMKCIISGK